MVRWRKPSRYQNEEVWFDGILDPKSRIRHSTVMIKFLRYGAWHGSQVVSLLKEAFDTPYIELDHVDSEAYYIIMEAPVACISYHWPRSRDGGG